MAGVAHRVGAAMAVTVAIALSLAPIALALGPPLVKSTSFSTADTSATLKASIDPNGASVAPARFEYVDQATFEASGFANALSAPVPDASIPAIVKGKGDIAAGSTVVNNLATSAGTFAAGQAISGPGLPSETTVVSVGTNPETGLPQLVLSKEASETKAAITLNATGPQPFIAQASGLTPASAYRFRVFAENKEGPVTSPETAFFTLAATPLFGPCPNDQFRIGPLAPLDHPSAALPECRAYEQASPTDKDGGDLVGDPDYVRAAAVGAGVIFGSTFALPGAQGAQDLPFALASRGAGESGWGSRSLLPPASTGEKVLAPKAWLPDFSQTFATATRLGNPRTEAFYELHADGSAPTLVGPYAPGLSLYDYAGASADGQTVVIEARAQLPAKEGEAVIAEARPDGASNVYAWDAASGRLHLASVMNGTPAETEAALPKGAFAGPYNWAPMQAHSVLGSGGAADRYYTQEENAVAEDGSVFFTAAGSGQLYQRINPTQPQSALDGQGDCTEPAKACTLHLSASDRTPPDPSGATPAAFMAATEDGKSAFFTSAEELTADANTGPVQAEAAIGRAKIGATEAEAKEPKFLPARRANGVAIDPAGEYIYWADPAKGTIGRAKLGPSGPELPEPDYIDPGETSFETRPGAEPGVIHSAPSTPRFVAVDSKYVYWTNTGPLGEGGFEGATDKPVDDAGTIGRAEIGATKAEDPEPEWITGASNPQGIAVNSEHVYWANAARDIPKIAIARADIEGHGVEQTFFSEVSDFNGATPSGVALTPSRVYFTFSEEGGNNGFLARIPLEGGAMSPVISTGNAPFRGIALDGSHVYWASQSEEAIGRADLELSAGSVEKEYLKPGGTPFGIATAGEHLYYSVNGETPPNPGADLYRYQANGAGSCAKASGCLTDLTPDSTDPNGAEVQGVVGASEDGSYLYFVANADLDDGGEATPGDCHPPLSKSGGSCNLYLLHAGQLSFIARLSKAGGGTTSDALNWAGAPNELFGGGGFYLKTALLSADGETLVFRSTEKLTDYDNHGVPEYYRYHDGEITCATCNPSGTPPTAAPTIATILFPTFGPLAQAASTVPRFLAADGERVFFETSEALVPADTNGEGGCPRVGTSNQNFAACQDVYEWEAPGTGSCEVGGPGYSPLNQGCIYLISTGKSPDPSFFADASESGDDVFFFTRSQLVGQDTDQLNDVYDARIGGGLAAQNPPSPIPCEGEACKPAVTPPPPYSAPPQFAGPPDPKPKRPKKGCAKGKKGKKKACHKQGKKQHADKHRRHGGAE